MQSKRTNKSKRIGWMDSGRGICMLLVIIYHCQAYYAKDASLSFVFTPFFLTFFFFISGYLFSMKKELDVKQKMLSIIRGIIWPYLIFSSLIWLPKSIAHGNQISLLIFFKDILGGYASWFVTALVVSEILFIIVKRITDSIFVTLAIGIGCIISSIILREILPTPTPWFFLTGLVSLFYIILGDLYRKSEFSLKWMKSRFLLILSIILYITAIIFHHYYLKSNSNLMSELQPVENPVIFFILSILGIVMMINITYYIPRVRILHFIGKYSLSFYFINGGVILLISKFLHKYNILIYSKGDIHKILIVATISTLIIYLITKIIVHYFPWMLGDKKSINKIASLLGRKKEYVKQ